VFAQLKANAKAMHDPSKVGKEPKRSELDHHRRRHHRQQIEVAIGCSMDIRQEEEKASQARLSSELRFSSIFIDP
jgi:hypothetical protein